MKERERERMEGKRKEISKGAETMNRGRPVSG